MSEKQGIVLTKKKAIALAAIALLLVIGGVMLGMQLVNQNEPSISAVTPDLDENAVDWEGEIPVVQGDKEQEGIAIPGYKVIGLKADQREQQVNFYNPQVNDCYFVISLLLEDGTELWKSKLIVPGKGLYEIELNQTLPAGTYENSILKYECYAMDDNLSELNGGEVQLTLEVV